jgi:CheY-like chemotaxis protein
MPHGGNLTVSTANVTVTADMRDRHAGCEPGPYVQVMVTDTGVGMSRDTIARIFEPFFTTKDRAGTGLGLATVYGFVKQSGGDVWVSSQPGHGSSFRLLLPRIDEVVSRVVPDAEPAAESADGHETILLVEDEAQLRVLLGTVLERHGYTVHRLADASEVRPWLETHKGPLHLVVTDMVMPNGTGLEVERIVRQLRPGLKILFMSGYAEHAATSMGDLPSDSHYLQKPFTPRVLATIVRDLLDRTTR